MEKLIINLADLVNDKVDLISGRSAGEDEVKKRKVIEHLRNNDRVVIRIDDKKVKAINDSFIKGFFSAVFKEFGSKSIVEKMFEIEGNDYYKRLFDKNWSILDALYSHAPSGSY